MNAREELERRSLGNRAVIDFDQQSFLMIKPDDLSCLIVARLTRLAVKRLVYPAACIANSSAYRPPLRTSSSCPLT